MKSQILIKSGQGKKFDKLNEGDHVISLQCNRVNDKGAEYQLETNMDWSFDENVTPEEIKCFLGSILSTVEDVFGEKMVTESVLHYAEERNHFIKTPQGKALYLRSKGLAFLVLKRHK